MIGTGVSHVDAAALDAARMALIGADQPVMAFGADLARASEPLGHLSDQQGAQVGMAQMTASAERFRYALNDALPGIDAGAVGQLWQAVSRHPGLQLAHEVLLTRALDPLKGLLTFPPAVVYTRAELAQIDACEQGGRGQPVFPQAPSGSVTGIVKITRLCNLRCTYCHDWRTGADASMAFAVRARAMRWLLQGSRARRVNLLLHGGEPSLIGVQGLTKLLALQARYRMAGQQVTTRMQSNGTRITPQLVELLVRFDVAVSVSMDGPPEVHDLTRKDIKGRASSGTVRETIRQLRRAGILNGVLIVVTPALIDAGAARLIDFLADDGIKHIGLLPMRPAAGTPASAATSLEVARFCRFMLEVEQARRERAPWIHVRELDAMFAALERLAPQTCELQGHCVGSYFSIEPDGSISHCDKYIGDSRYVMGSVDQPYAEVARGAVALALRAQAAAASTEKQACPWWSQCKGWCPHEDYVARSGPEGAGGCCGLAPLFGGLHNMRRESAGSGNAPGA
jgi:uncharacterized protein